MFYFSNFLICSHRIKAERIKRSQSFATVNEGLIGHSRVRNFSKKSNGFGPRQMQES